MLLEGWARDGLTDEQICGKIGIHVATLCEWKNRFPELRDAIKKGKAPVDTEVENSLLKRAMGYQYEETITEIESVPTGKIGADGNEIMRQVKHIRKVLKTALPDTTAQIFWLKNRRPDKWRERQEVSGSLQIGGTNNALKEAFEKMKQGLGNERDSDGAGVNSES